MGQTDGEMAQDKEHYANKEHKINDHIARARAEREQQRTRATAELDTAIQTESALSAAITVSIDKLRDGKDSVEEAMVSLAKMQNDIERLGKQEQELVRLSDQAVQNRRRNC